MTLNIVLYVAAVVCFAIAALLGFGVFDGAHVLGWVGLGSVLFAGAHVPIP